MTSTFGTRIELAQQIVGTWAGGTTNRIYAYPDDPTQAIADSQFWFGTAAIQRNAAYSFFPERIRIHMPIQGHGIRLQFQEPAECVTLTTFDQYRFDGTRPVHVELADGPIVALNLIFHTAVHAEADIVCFEQQQFWLPALDTVHLMRVRIVYAITGSAIIRHANDLPVVLHAGDAFIVDPGRGHQHPVLLLEQQEATAACVVVTALLP